MCIHVWYCEKCMDLAANQSGSTSGSTTFKTASVQIFLLIAEFPYGEIGIM